MLRRSDGSAFSFKPPIGGGGFEASPPTFRTCCGWHRSHSFVVLSASSIGCWLD